MPEGRDQSVDLFEVAGRHPPRTPRPARKRKLVDEMRREWGASIRRTRKVLMVDTSTCHSKSRRPGQAILESRTKEICQTRARYGYRRVHVLLRREGRRLNHKKTIACIASWACSCATRRPSAG